jgi:hypothetical protein
VSRTFAPSTSARYRGIDQTWRNHGTIEVKGKPDATDQV